MAETLNVSLPPERLHPAFNNVDQQLASRKDAGGEGADGKGFRLNIVNDLWGQQDYQFLPEFLDLLAVNYGAGLRLVDFQNRPEESRGVINNYIAEQTEQRIKDLLPAGAVSPATRMVLTNAVYFNAAWWKPFEEGGTQDAPFTRLDGSVVDVHMMRRTTSERLQYAQGEGY
jgi:serpin B